MLTANVIPVPVGWSAEQSWETICRDRPLPRWRVWWAIVMTRDGVVVRMDV